MTLEPKDAQPGTVQPVQPETVQPGTVQPGTVQPTGAQPKAVPAKVMPAKVVPAKAAPARAVPAKAVPAKAVPAKPGPAKPGPAKVAAPKSGQPRMVTSAERLRRLLALVPYVSARRVVGLAETAATFGMSERELIDDLNLAWCVELRAPEPYCPIDLSYEDGEISISQAESIARPLRLAADEASALLVALRMLAEAGGDGDAVYRLIAKIESAAGAAGAASAQVAIQIDNPGGGGTAAALNAALSAGRRVHLRYYVPGRDEETERDVDPMRLLVMEGRTYLEGWCRSAEGVRLFRLDRVLAVDVLDVAASVPDEAEPVDVDAGLFRASPSDVLAELELAPGARWVAEYYPCESVTEQPDGGLRIGLRTPDTTWVRRLVLRLGEDARVVAPPALADEVQSAAAAALALYD